MFDGKNSQEGKQDQDCLKARHQLQVSVTDNAHVLFSSQISSILVGFYIQVTFAAIILTQIHNGTGLD